MLRGVHCLVSTFIWDGGSYGAFYWQSRPTVKHCKHCVSLQTWRHAVRRRHYRCDVDSSDLPRVWWRELRVLWGFFCTFQGWKLHQSRFWLPIECTIRQVSDRLHLSTCMRETWEHLLELVRNMSSSHHVESDTGALLVVLTKNMAHACPPSAAKRFC